jgi:ABC-type sugar transport system ATPase subunit
MGDRVAVLKKGVLQQVDAPQRLYEHPDNLFVAGFHRFARDEPRPCRGVGNTRQPGAGPR